MKRRQINAVTSFHIFPTHKSVIRRCIFYSVDKASVNKARNKQLSSTEAADEVVRGSANSRGDVRRPAGQYPAATAAWPASIPSLFTLNTLYLLYVFTLGISVRICLHYKHLPDYFFVTSH
jgi:hypothetical protein